MPLPPISLLRSCDDPQIGFELPSDRPPSPTYNNFLYNDLAGDANTFPKIDSSDTWLLDSNNVSTPSPSARKYTNMARMISALPTYNRNLSRLSRPPSSYFLATLHSPQLIRRFCEATTLLGSEECINSIIFSQDDQSLISASE